MVMRLAKVTVLRLAVMVIGCWYGPMLYVIFTLGALYIAGEINIRFSFRWLSTTIIYKFTYFMLNTDINLKMLPINEFSPEFLPSFQCFPSPLEWIVFLKWIINCFS